MRVLHAADSYLPKIGGIELHVRDRMAHQRAAGDEALLVTAAPGPDADGVCRANPERRGTLGDRRLCIERALRELRPDVVHVHASIISPFAYLAARTAAERGVPVLVTMHSMWSGLGPLPHLTGAVLGLRGLPIAWSAVSARAAEPLRVMLGPDVPVHVLPNAVDLDQWHPVDVPASGVPTVVSVMRLTRIKRTMPLLRMLAELPSLAPGSRAVVVGDGPLREAAHRFVQREGLEDVVSLPGRLAHDRIQALLAEAALFVAPAERESFGIAALEARAMGLPVVGSSRSGLTEFITDGVDGFLAPDDVTMVRRVGQLLRDDALRTRMTAHNRAVAPRHDWAHTTAVARSLYSLAAAEAARTPARAAVAQPTRVAVGR
ncbi:MAG TPA: glycosyltransferase family 4 protein [Propionibacteriaceae bacterium]|nr:glycosyltransferase family 4 protein [Propionibacteriaceae bacterium]